MKKFYLILIIILLSNSCVFDKNPDRRDIKVINQSNNIIYCLSSFSDTIDSSNLGHNEQTFNKSYKINKDTFRNVYDKPPDWDSFINHYGTIRLFIILKDTVEKYGWNKVISKNMYNKLFKLNIDSLNKNNWKIVYKSE